MKQSIGFIGLGHMGLPMANNLLKAGYSVYAYDLQATVMAQWQDLGGKTVTQPQDLPTVAHVIITMLQTGDQVRGVCLGEAGLFAHAQPGSLFIDCSSIDVQSARDVHAQASAHGLLSLDAPVSGGVGGAEAGTLTFMVGGEAVAVEVATDILLAMGKKIVHTGAAGSGQMAKICNNMILGISMAAISEAFVLAEKWGLKPDKLFEVVNNASGQCWALSKYVPVPGILENVPANRDYQPGFTAQMMLKDLKLSQQAASQVDMPTTVAAQATALYEQMVAAGMGGLDFSAIIRWINQEQ